MTLASREDSVRVALTRYVRGLDRSPIARRLPGMWFYTALGVGIRLATTDPELAQLVYRSIVTSDPEETGGEIVTLLTDNVAHLARTAEPTDRTV